MSCRHDLLTRLQVISHDFVWDQTDSQPTQDARWHSILRILYIYALLNPAMGYIQCMNEVAFVLLYVFGHLGADITAGTETIHGEDPDMEAVLRSSEHAEADAFWCFSALIADLRDLYTFDGLDRAAAGLSGHGTPLHLGSGVLQSGNMAATLRSFSYRLHWVDLELWKTLVRSPYLLPFGLTTDIDMNDSARPISIPNFRTFRSDGSCAYSVEKFPFHLRYESGTWF